MLRFIQLLPVFAALLLAGCATAPSQEMADARLELQAAEAAHAARYAPEPLIEARRRLAEAESRLELGSYNDARRSAERARSNAALARALAEAMSKAEQAIERAQRAGTLWPVAEQSWWSARHAVQQRDAATAMAYAARVVHLLDLNENQAALESARLTLDACPPAQREANAGIVSKAQQALRDGNGKLADELAQRACMP